MTDEAYQGMDPNSQHQLWSSWVFGIQASPTKRPDVREVVDNARRYFTTVFHSTTGRVRCDEQGGYYVVIIEIERPPAHDVTFASRVRDDFRERFVKQGFGPKAQLVRFEVSILAGDQQDGKPPDQLLVMPYVSLTQLHGV